MKNKSRLIIASISVVAIAATVPVIADGGWGKKHKKYRMMELLISQLDLNKDGDINQIEIDSMRAQKLEEFDKDNNSTIELKEFEGLWLSMMRNRMVDSFQHLDEDGDGRITSIEMSKPVEKMIARLDENQDGVLAQEEIQAAKKRYHWSKRYKENG